MMKKAIPIDVYTKEGNLSHIEFNDEEGNHIIDAIWDETDEQTSENRTAFRNWAYKFLKRKGYEIFN